MTEPDCSCEQSERLKAEVTDLALLAYLNEEIGIGRLAELLGCSIEYAQEKAREYVAAEIRSGRLREQAESLLALRAEFTDLLAERDAIKSMATQATRELAATTTLLCDLLAFLDGRAGSVLDLATRVRAALAAGPVEARPDHTTCHEQLVAATRERDAHKTAADSVAALYERLEAIHSTTTAELAAAREALTKAAERFGRLAAIGHDTRDWGIRTVAENGELEARAALASTPPGGG
jgi:hypothetical protein